ncbi:sushi domain-containing protein 2 isoform X2 [Hippoglossus stenolepis]|uniref:sushi domain-containing protein 2 isoform X2 n=1 Tax=Hippoglossus stenolepis TaxID=195615 RepID=UPI001FB02CB0|nr:sushi domain-containing protein 2 isoform X2 [Hippoglossus stenolepis]
MCVHTLFSSVNTNLMSSIFLCGVILIFSSNAAAGETCRGSCGHVQDECSCHPTCVSLLSCCSDYNQSCFQVTPHSSSMLGGRALRILGFVLPPGGRLLCRFKKEIVREGFIDAEGRAHCISPLLYETGWIPFDVSEDGISFDRSGEYLSVHPSKADPASEVTLVNATQWQNYGTPDVAGRLNLTWNSSLIGADKVDIELWGYREFNRSTEAAMNGSSPLQAELSYLFSLGRNLVNSGTFSFIPEALKDQSDCQLGNIRITASSKSDGARDEPGLWSRAHVLAWNFEQTFRDDSAAWAENKCLQWDVVEKEQPGFLRELIDCPCTLAQARADAGRFHTDYSCDIERGSVCTYHPGSVHCVRAIQASPTHGSGQQCCYDSSGALMLTGDSFGGSSPDRAHDWGSPPYREPPRVPGYSHWLYDVMSFQYCCLWSDHCQIYFNHRPSSGCRSYQPPKAGFVFGDPHFITFDGLSYTFNGEGEFDLVSSPERKLSIQARTERVELQNSTLAKATWLSAVAMKERSSDVIEVRLAERRLQVLRNQRVLPFTEQRWMDLHRVFVSVPGSHTVTVMFLSGVGVEVRLHEGIMAATVLLPSEFTNHTRGLLGFMNSDPSGDLLTRQGEVLPSHGATLEEIFTFGTGWKVPKMSSLFTHDSKRLLEAHSFTPSPDPAFVPAFSLPETPDDPLVAGMLTTCVGEGARFCKYDTLTTRSLAVGNSTLWAHRNFQALMDALQPVVSCGWLPPPRYGKKNGTRYLEGNTLSFSCNEGFILFRSTQRTCLDDGTWSGEQPFCVKDDKVRFILGAVGSISAVVVMGVMIQLHKRKQDRDREVKLEQMSTQEQIC